LRRGEFGLIDAFVAQLPRPPVPFGPGDDAAVLAASKNPLCITTDAVVEGVHFTRPRFSLSDIGHKALAVNLSDLAAMGARPTWWLCALGLPKSFTNAHAASLARGMAPLAKRHGLQLVGGNLTGSPVLTVTITAAGETGDPLLRSGARAGDLLYVSGALGSAAAGLRAGARAALVTAQKRPTPRVELGLVAARFASAAIDVSDGLLGDLGHLCDASRAGAALESTRIPRARGVSLDLALNGGEDYQLLLAVPPRRAAAFERAAGDITLIGQLTRTRGITVDGRAASGKGFDHFRR
jgi:thiamine-monophosphate kinase